jgi:hypothetical protein
MFAISSSASQKGLSRHTLELRLLIVTYLLTIIDLRRASLAGEILSIARKTSGGVRRPTIDQKI